ncbi:MAG: Lrp/AsnC family transcriptional regulator [Candidatus Altiarchaeota archaeon]
MDEKDLELLKIIGEDARIPLKELGTMLGVNVDEVEKRVAKLEKDKVIRSYHTVVDWQKTGEEKILAEIQVKVTPQERSGFARICREIAKDDRVINLFVATGEYDMFILAEAKSIHEIANFVTEKLAPKKEVQSTNTHIVLNEYKRSNVLLFEEKDKRLPLSP